MVMTQAEYYETRQRKDAIWQGVYSTFFASTILAHLERGKTPTAAEYDVAHALAKVIANESAKRFAEGE